MNAGEIAQEPKRGIDVPYPIDLHTLVPMILDAYPSWDEFDIVDFLEEKTGRRLGPEDFQTLRAVFVRVYLLRKEFEG